MVEIELTQDEVNVLRDILKTHLSELTFEIAFTHNKEFTQVLKKKRDFVVDFLQRLEGIPGSAKISPGAEGQFFAES